MEQTAKDVVKSEKLCKLSMILPLVRKKGIKLPFRKRREIDFLGETYDDDSAGDGDRRHHGGCDGVWFYGIHDALIVTVNPSLVWLVHDVHNDEGQCSFKEKKGMLLCIYLY